MSPLNLGVEFRTNLPAALIYIAQASQYVLLATALVWYGREERLAG